MTRGFITLATGKEYYSYLAANLLLSYRYHTKKPMPFAIITEEENEYTDLFDDVIIVKDTKRSFMDKFLLFKVCPYDESIFLDADSLAYGDLNEWWPLFVGATDFSGVGGVLPLSDKGGGMYDVGGIGRYKDKIDYKVWIHAGVLFVRKSKSLEKLYDDCMDVIANYGELKELRNGGSYDEVSMGIAMSMNNMRPVEEPDHLLAFIPCCKSVDADICNGRLSYVKMNGVEVKDVGKFLHFTNRETLAPLYRYEVKRLRHAIEEKKLPGRSYYLCLKMGYKLSGMYKTLKSLPSRVLSRLKRYLKK